MGFLFVLVVFTQHGWSLTIAGTTYMMLVSAAYCPLNPRVSLTRDASSQRFPTSRAMGYVEAYWYAVPIFIWGICAVLTGGEHHALGSTKPPILTSHILQQGGTGNGTLRRIRVASNGITS